MTLREAKRIMRAEYEQRTGYKPSPQFVEKLARKLQQKARELNRKGAKK